MGSAVKLACLAAGAAALLAGGGAARAACQLQVVGELPVIQAQGHLLLPTSINGRPVMMIADTGAFASGLYQGAPELLGLTTRSFGGGARSFRVSGVGGRAEARVATVAELKFGKFVVRNVDLIVAGHRIGSGAVVGLIGADLFSQYDIEVDLAHSVIRLLKDTGCADAQMPYWSNKAYSQAPIERGPDLDQGFFTRLQLNGHPVEAKLDTGASITSVTPAAARAAGATPEAGGPTVQVGGLGANRVDAEVYTFDTVGLGDETVKDVRLLAADMFRYNTEDRTGTRLGQDTSGEIRALIGLDFFRSHHVLISPARRLMYFTYERGEPFMAPRRRPPVQTPAAPASAAAPGAQPPATSGSPPPRP